MYRKNKNKQKKKKKKKYNIRSSNSIYKVQRVMWRSKQLIILKNSNIKRIYIYRMQMILIENKKLIR